VCRYNYGVGGDIWNITWRHITVGTSNSLSDTWGGDGGWTSVSSSLMVVETLGEVMGTGGWFSLLEDEDNGEVNAEYLEWCRGSPLLKENRENLMVFVTQIQPCWQFRSVKIKGRDVAALRRARVKGRSQVRDGKEKFGWAVHIWVMESIRKVATFNINE